MSLIQIFFSPENKEFYSFRFFFTAKKLFLPFFWGILMLIVLTQLWAAWVYNAYEP